MTELSITYKGVTITETFERPLPHEIYSHHLNCWFDLIDQKVKEPTTVVPDIVVDGHHLRIVLKHADELYQGLSHVAKGNFNNEEPIKDDALIDVACKHGHYTIEP